MEHIVSVIKVVASVFLAIGCIVIAVLFFTSSKSSSQNAMSEMSSVNNELSNSTLKVYDNMPVLGDEVVNAIKKYNSDLNTTFSITVKTLINTTGKKYAAAVTSFPAKGTDDFINPTGDFMGSLTYDSNKNINGIVFTQQN